MIEYFSNLRLDFAGCAPESGSEPDRTPDTVRRDRLAQFSPAYPQLIGGNRLGALIRSTIDFSEEERHVLTELARQLRSRMEQSIRVLVGTNHDQPYVADSEKRATADRALMDRN
jgi:hypothetical protein